MLIYWLTREVYLIWHVQLCSRFKSTWNLSIANIGNFVTWRENQSLHTNQSKNRLKMPFEFRECSAPKLFSGCLQKT